MDDLTMATSNWRSLSVTDRNKIVRFSLLVLRHHPERFNLPMDRLGWVEDSGLFRCVREMTNGVLCCPVDLREILGDANFDQRLQFDNDRIRAAYGHSTRRFSPDPTLPPDDIRLFHGSNRTYEICIFSDGLRPMARRFVQLTTRFWYAFGVGSGSNRSPIVFEIDVNKALEAGVRFYTTGSHVWFCDAVDSTCLKIARQVN
jgi:putative RNA 2'-phosphotransferase